MKTIILLLVLITSFEVCGQLRIESGSYVFHTAAMIEGSKSSLYNSALSWVEVNYINDNAVQYASEKEGKILVKGVFESEIDGMPSVVYYTFTIQLARGAYKETYSEFQNRARGKTLVFEHKKVANKKKLLIITDERIRELSASFKTHMESEKVLAVQ